MTTRPRRTTGPTIAAGRAALAVATVEAIGVVGPTETGETEVAQAASATTTTVTSWPPATETSPRSIEPLLERTVTLPPAPPGAADTAAAIGTGNPDAAVGAIIAFAAMGAVATTGVDNLEGDVVAGENRDTSPPTVRITGIRRIDAAAEN